MDTPLKKCCTCGLLRSVTDFNKRARAADGLQSRCRSCCRDWYLANRQSHGKVTRARSKSLRDDLANRLMNYLLEHPCLDCGMSDIRCLEFDHRDPAEKRYNVAAMVELQKSWVEILSEIEKCDIRCANCHRIRTAAQFCTRRHRVMEEQVLPALRAAAIMRLEKILHPVGLPDRRDGEGIRDGRDLVDGSYTGQA
jgi:hypothetical protein